MRKKLGNIFIIFSLGLLIFIYYPLILIFFVPQANLSVTSGNYISIPKIEARASIIKDVDPWDQKNYEGALKKGVAQAKDLPNFYFAHSSLPFWEMTRANTSFLRLQELKTGDQIIIVSNGQEKIYLVSGKKEVWPWETEAILEHPNEIILQTCLPVGTALRRLLVFAKAS